VTFNPSSTGIKNLVLNASGRSAITSWIQGQNNGFVIASEGATDGIDLYSEESGNGAHLTLTLNNDACGGGGGNPPETITINENRDTTISSKQASRNLNSSLSDIEADASDGTYGEMMALIGFPMGGDIPSCANVESAQLILNIDNVSSGEYGIYASTGSWTAGNATWNSMGGTAIKGTLIGSFTPSSLGTFTYNLNSSSASVIEGWLTGANNGLVIASKGTTNGVIIEDGGSDQPKLKVTFNTNQCNS
jgi:hypothetical protein